ncbi:hypothetical protein OC844_002894 [Tilletia horrida]|nr:hypothetical protein OC844_002894 [Tilletia horrida]
MYETIIGWLLVAILAALVRPVYELIHPSKAMFPHGFILDGSLTVTVRPHEPFHLPAGIDQALVWSVEMVRGEVSPKEPASVKYQLRDDKQRFSICRLENGLQVVYPHMVLFQKDLPVLTSTKPVRLLLYKLKKDEDKRVTSGSTSTGAGDDAASDISVNTSTTVGPSLLQQGQLLSCTVHVVPSHSGAQPVLKSTMVDVKTGGEHAVITDVLIGKPRGYTAQAPLLASHRMLFEKPDCLVMRVTLDNFKDA